MRPKVLIAVLLLATGLLGIVVLLDKSFRLRPDTESPNTDNSAPAITEPAPDEPMAASLESPESTRPSSLAQNAQPPAALATDGGAPDESVGKRIAELEELAMNDDAASRDAILAELQNPDKEIRKAALEAAIQFNDRSVVPRLQEIAAQMEDPGEKAAVLEAIDYINLPSLSEYLAERKAQRAAMGLTNGPPFSTNGISTRPSRRPPSQPSLPPQNGP